MSRNCFNSNKCRQGNFKTEVGVERRRSFSGRRDKFHKRNVDLDLNMDLAHEMVNADLMQEELTETRFSAERIAVLDGGFAQKANVDMATPVIFTYCFNGALRPNKDWNHHGTPVVALFVGAHNIGLTKNTIPTVYSIMRNSRIGVDLADAKMPMMKA